MSFRTVMVSRRCKLDYRMNYIEIRGDDTKKILLDEIDTLIVENPAISITGSLMSALIDKKIAVIFCDSKHNPQFELTSLYGSHDCSRKIKKQIQWEEHFKGKVWAEIVREKIRKQSELLLENGLNQEAELLNTYIGQVQHKDETNREGHAAKVYFNALFGMKFTRNDEIPTNAALNYGYALILSMFNREVVINGYLTQIGLFHDNIYNQFNLSSDLMEPFRPIVDRFVFDAGYLKFESNEKHEMLNIFNTELRINKTTQSLNNCIKIYVKSTFDALNEEDLSLLSFYEL